MRGILIAILVMVVLGFVLGFIVSLVSTKFAVKEDERQKTIASLLPGANCGACGNPGCEAYAKKIFSHESDGSSCPVIKGEAKEKLFAYIKENL